MGLGTAQTCGVARCLLELAGSECGVDASRLLVRGGPALERTEVLQPVMTAVSLGAMEALRRRGCRPDAVAGHSLGEIAAWSAAGALDPEGAVSLAAARGQIMAREAARRPGTMVALFGGEQQVASALESARLEGIADLAGHNAPDEWVLSGEPQALRAAAAGCSARPLRVAGAWHSRLLARAVGPFQRCLAALRPGRLRSRLVSNGTGGFCQDEELAEGLAQQLVRPVLWAQCLRTLADAGVSHFVTVGPGRILRGLLRKNLGRQIRILSTESQRAMDATVAALRGAGSSG